MSNQQETGQPEVFTCRLRDPALRLALKEAAQADGRTNSAEIEYLVGIALAERQFKHYALISFINEAIMSLPQAQRYSLPAVLAIVEAAFELEKTYGPPRKRRPETNEDAFAGRVAFYQSWDEMRRLDPRDHKLTPRQLYLLSLQQALGPLVDRAVVFGIDGREVKRRAAAFPRKKFLELHKLSSEAHPVGKPGEDPSPPVRLSPKKHKRYLELYNELADVLHPENAPHAEDPTNPKAGPGTTSKTKGKRK